MNKEVEKIIGYTFRDGALLERALTHSSAGRDNYQKLEFLGDSVVGYVVARKLYEMFPDEGEGVLTRLRARVVSEKPLAAAADEKGLSAFIRLGEAETKAGVGGHSSVKSDVVEAVAAAICLDGGMEAAARFVLSFLGAEMERVESNPYARDAKTALNEYAQKHGVVVEYVELERTGAPHEPEYVFAVSVGGRVRGEGSGKSKRAAQQAAAKNALSVLSAGAKSLRVPSGNRFPF